MTSLDMMIPAGIKNRYIFHLDVVPLSWIVNLLNLACFIAGITFIFLGGVIETVGVAMLVGALFSEGAFVGQLWTITAQNNYMVYYRLWGEERFARLEDLKERMANLSDQVDRVREEAPPQSGSN